VVAYVAVRAAHTMRKSHQRREKLGPRWARCIAQQRPRAGDEARTKQEQAVTPQREIAPQQEQSLDIG